MSRVTGVCPVCQTGGIPLRMAEAGYEDAPSDDARVSFTLAAHLDAAGKTCEGTGQTPEALY